MLFYFHFLYSFPFNVISVATVLCFCGFHPPVVSTLLWFPPSHGFHPCGFHLPMVSTFPWLLCGFHLSMVSTLCGYSVVWFAPSCHLHLCMVPTLPWLLRGVPSVVCTFMVYTLSRGFHPPTLPWFASLRGSHPPCGYSVVSLLWFALSWFTLCRGFHPPVVCIFTWFPPSLWLLRGLVSLAWCVPFRGLHSAMVSTLLWLHLWWFHPPVVSVA